MSYLVLARKWRPLAFSEVIGQEHIVRTLQNAIASNRIAHAYLFTGPRGVGKTTTARILAKCLNCVKGPTAEPCGECSNCRGISEGSGQSLDVIEIDGASNNGVEEVRNLRENVRYTPAQARFKIIIIDEVHMLTQAAFNALLKTLEEPPSHVVFLFATTEPQKVPATILSRCQRFDFKRIPMPAIEDHLRKICSNEQIGVEPQVLALIARKADGGLRDAQSLLDQVISFSGVSVTLAEASTVLGLVDETLFFRLTDAIRDQSAPEGLKLAGEVQASGFDAGEFLSQLLVHFRNLLVTCITQDTSILEVAEETRAKYQAAALDFTPEDLLRLIAIVTDTEAQLKRGAQPATRLELALLSMVYLDKSTTIAEILDRLQRAPDQQSPVRPAVSPGPAAGRTYPSPPLAPAVHDAAPPAAAAISAPASGMPALSDIQAQWNDIVQTIKQESSSLGNFLGQSRPARIQGRELTAVTTNGNGSLSLLQAQAGKLGQMISSHLQCAVQIRFEAGETTPQTATAAPAQSPQVSDAEILQRTVAGHPIIKDVIEMFDADLLRVKREKILPVDTPTETDEEPH